MHKKDEKTVVDYEDEPGVPLRGFDDPAGKQDDLDNPASLVEVDEEVHASCCNPKCALQHVGSAGYSIENAVVYADTALNFAMGLGMFGSTPMMVFTIIMLSLITTSLAMGNYRSYLSIMDKFLSRFSYFQRWEMRGLVEATENETSNAFWNGVGITNAILKVAIPSYSVYRVSNTIYTGLFGIQSIAPAAVTVSGLAVLALPSSLAFFDQGNHEHRPIDPDATFDEGEMLVLEERIDLEADRHTHFSRVVKNPRVALFEDEDVDTIDLGEDDIESDSDKEKSRCCCVGCCSAKCVVQHAGTAGYSVQNATLYSNAAYFNLNNWGLMDAYPILSGIGVLVITGSVTIANYNSYLVLMDNFLSRHFRSSEQAENSETFCWRLWKGIVTVNIFPATFFKVGVSTLTFFRVSNRILQGNLPSSITLTAVVSAANVLATAGLFSLKTNKPVENRVEVLSDDEIEEVVETQGHKK